MNENNSALPERRRAERFPLALDVWCCYTPKQSKQDQKIKAVSKDISGVGLSILSKRPLSTNISLGLIVSSQKKLHRGDQLDFSVGDKEKGVQFFSIRCKVVWSKKLADDKYESGISYVNIEKQEEFVHFVCEKMMDNYQD